MKKNLFLTFCCACVPGCGQMYLGYMKRGLSLAFYFWGIIALMVLTYMPFLAFLLPIIFAFAFFDTFNIRNLSPEQIVLFHDDFLPNTPGMRAFWANKNSKSIAGKLLGWAFLIVGCFMIFYNIIEPYLWYIGQTYPIIHSIIRSIPTLFVAGGLILLGIYILRRKKTPTSSDNDEITPFGSNTQPPVQE